MRKCLHLDSCDSDLQESGRSKIKAPEKRLAEILMQIGKRAQYSDVINLFKKQTDLHLYFLMERIACKQQNVLSHS